MTKKASAKAPAPRRLRADYDVYNEATAFIVTSAGMLARGIEPGQPAWSAAVKAGDLIPVELVQDDPFVMRVVLGRLSREEEAECVGRLRWKLRVPDGRLVVAGGRELLSEPADSDVSALLRQYMHEIRIPPGEFAAEVICCLPGINGTHQYARAGGRKPEPVGAYFRRTRKGQAFPVWLHEYCRARPEDDPGHELAWDDARPRKRKRPLVDFILHLEPLTGRAGRLPRMSDGAFFSFDAFDARLPARCPLGLEAPSPRKPPRPRAKRVEHPPTKAVDVRARLAGLEPAPVAGGPVEISVSRLADVVRLAEATIPGVHPEIQVELPPRSIWPAAAIPVIGLVVVEMQDRTVRVGLDESCQGRALPPTLDAVGAALATLPDGARVELMIAPDPDEADHRQAGRHRYAGPVSQGRWRIEHTFPAVGAETLRDALALSAAVTEGRGLSLRDQAEVARVMKEVEDGAFLYQDNPVSQDGLRVSLREPEPRLVEMWAGKIFRARYRDVWPFNEDEDDEGDDELDAAVARLGAAITAKVASKTTGVVLEGRAGTYSRVDLLAARPTDDNHVRYMDRQLAAAGYQPFGDVVCSSFGEVIVRGYGQDGGDTWGVLMSGALQSRFEFLTRFDGDASLITTMAAGQKDEPDKNAFRSSHPNLDPRKLHTKHQQRKRKLGRTLGPPCAAPPDLRVFAEAMDAALARQMGLGN